MDEENICLVKEVVFYYKDRKRSESLWELEKTSKTIRPTRIILIIALCIFFSFPLLMLLCVQRVEQAAASTQLPYLLVAGETERQTDHKLFVLLIAGNKSGGSSNRLRLLGEPFAYS